MSEGVIEVGVGSNGQAVSFLTSMSNRHGLVAGATGTGKTVTLQRLAEGFSRQGVPVFTADVKGDLAGLAKPGVSSERIQERLKRAGRTTFEPRACPTLFWDLFAKNGHHVRSTISEVGPLILGRILNLNETQEQVLQVIFKIADDQGLLLLDLKDLKELCTWVGNNASELRESYGNMATQTIGAIQRAILTLEQAGGSAFFGEPALSLQHLMQVDFSGQGVVSVLDATHLLKDSRLYSSFLLWLLSELFEQLPEVGDLPKPKLVFFFDEAHLLFQDANSGLIEKVEQLVRLIRSKGVGVYFVTQNPLDIPQRILSQLGNRVQHALRAFTPQDQRAVKTAATTFRANPAFDSEEVITQLEVGEALVSVLDAKGSPTPVERVLILPPESRIGPITEAERGEIVGRSPIKGFYEAVIDRESAFEVLQKRARERQQEEAAAKSKAEESSGSIFGSIFGGGKSRRQSTGEAMVKSVVRSMGSTLGREIMRGIFGSMKR